MKFTEECVFNMLRTAIWFAYFWIYQLKSIGLLKRMTARHEDAVMRGDLSAERDIVNEIGLFAGKWARDLVSATGSTVDVRGLENLPKDRTILFVCNHQGSFDIPLAIGYLPVPKGFVAKVEMLKMPLVGKWMKLMKCVFIDRRDKRKSIMALNEASKNLATGYSLLLFPEGTRSKSSTVGEFRASLSKLIQKSDVTVVPVTIDGSYRIMESNGNIIKPANVTLTVGQPIDTAGLTKQEVDALTDNIRDTIISSINRSPK
jgi:1-acyl-sn-glycerol-3-phosphate acyltransferase